MSSYRNRLAGKAALVASAALLAVALPSSVVAIGAMGDTGFESRIAFTPASADPAVAEMVAERTGGQARIMRFTPASAAASRAERSVTVAVRVDQQTAAALAMRIGAAPADNGGLRVTPTRYNLGIARGYSSFTQAPAQLAAAPAPRTPGLSRSLSDANIPDISEYNPRAGAREEPSRFAARVQLDDGRSASRAGQARNSVSDQMLDVGGSYRLTGNLNITAGVRYEQDRDIVPLPEVDQLDSQAVYVGTQFRF